MKIRGVLFIILACMAFACNSVQKSVDPSGEGPIPRGSNMDIDEDTIKSPGSDTSDIEVADSVTTR